MSTLQTNQSTHTSSHLSSVWLLDGSTVDDEALAPYLVRLNADELTRYQRFIKPLRQRQFLLGRVLLRAVLSNLLQLPDEQILLVEQPNNAPLLVKPNPDHYPDLGFSLSHSGNWIACAVSLTTKLGVDIEELDATRQLDLLSQHTFNADEIALIHAQSGAEKVATFYTLWSTKEARFKLNQNHDLLDESVYRLAHSSVSIVLCTRDALSDFPALHAVSWEQLINSITNSKIRVMPV